MGCEGKGPTTPLLHIDAVAATAYKTLVRRLISHWPQNTLPGCYWLLTCHVTRSMIDGWCISDHVTYLLLYLEVLTARDRGINVQVVYKYPVVNKSVTSSNKGSGNARGNKSLIGIL